MKYKIHLYQRIDQYAYVEVEAQDEKTAREIADSVADEQDAWKIHSIEENQVVSIEEIH